MSQKPNFSDVDESNPNKPSVAERTRTTNEAGGEAFEPDSAELGLLKVVVNNLLEDSYYDTVDESFDKIWEAFDRTADANPEFVLKLATYARQEEGLRDIPQLLLVMAANDERVVLPDENDVSWVRDYTPCIIDRTDEFNSVLSYQLRGYGTPVPTPLQKGIEDALHEKYMMVEHPSSDDVVRVTYTEREDGQARENARVEAVRDHVGDVVQPEFEEAFVNHGIVDEGYVHDSYTMAKYSARNKSTSFHDVLNLVRPNPRSDDRKELFERIARGELDESDVEALREDRTWEATRSDEDDDRDEDEQWRDRLDDMGIFARIRNLRNMREAGLDGSEVFDYDGSEFGTRSEEIVRNSKALPMRYYQAWKAAKDATFATGRYSDDAYRIGSSDVLDGFSEQWLESAIDVSTQNLPDTLENTYTAIDLSGSMSSPVSEHSELQCNEIGSLFGAMLLKRGSDAGVFATDFTGIRISDRARENYSTLDLTEEIVDAGSSIGSSTNAWKVLDWATGEGVEYDRFVFMTDMQVWDSTHGLFSSSTTLKDKWDEYREQVNPDATLYMVDLNSYGTLTHPESRQDVVEIQGWSDSIVEYIDKYERGDEIVDDVESITLTDY